MRLWLGVCQHLRHISDIQAHIPTNVAWSASQLGDVAATSRGSRISIPRHAAAFGTEDHIAVHNVWRIRWHAEISGRRLSLK